MDVELAALYENLEFMAPLCQARAEALVDFLAAGLKMTPDPLVLDIGCGWGELLLQVLTAVPSATGIGIDSDLDAITHGRQRAEHREIAGRVDLQCADARTASPEGADAVICIGASQIWGPPVEQAQPLDYPAALSALRAMVPRGSRVLYGEGIWSRPPTPAAIAPLAGRDDEYVALPRLLELTVEYGFAPIQVHEATQDEWDVFESGYSARYAHWLAAHEYGHHDAARVRELAARQRTAYFDGYRGVLGLAYLGLVAV